MSIDSGFKYWAFISYSHADDELSAWLHKALERYRVPRALVGRETPRGSIPKRLFPNFRDREELAGDASLSERIAASLAQSRFLIVICSPYSVASKYVDQEIRTFKKLGREDRVLCLIVAGEPGASAKPDAGVPEAFPKAVRFRVATDGELTDREAEPLAADVRPGKDGKTNAKLKLLAGMLGVGYDELKQREKHRQRWRVVQLAVGTLLVAGIVAGVWWNRQRAVEEQETSAAARVAAAASLDLTDKDVRRRLSLALQSVHLTRDRYGYVLPEAEIALYRALTDNALRGTFVENDTVDGFGGWTWPVALSHDGRRVLAPAAIGPTVLLGAEAAKHTVLKDAEMPYENDFTAIFSKDGKHAVTGGNDGVVRIWTMDGRLESRFRAHAADLVSLDQSADGASLLTVGCDRGPSYQSCDKRSARLWTLAGKPLGSFTHEDAGVVAAAWSPNDAQVLTVDETGALRLWSASGALQRKLSGRSYWVNKNHFTPDGKRFVMGDCSPYLRAGMFSPLPPPACKPGDEPDARAGLYDGQGELLRILPGWFAVIDPTGTRIATRTEECDGNNPCRYRVHLWNAANGAAVGEFSVRSPIVDIAFSPEGELLAVAHDDGKIGTLEIHTIDSRLLAAFGGVTGITSARFTDDGDRLVTVSCSNGHQGACLERTVQVWDPNGALLKSQQVASLAQPIPNFGSYSPMLKLSGSGSVAFIATGLQPPLLWNSRTGERIALRGIDRVIQSAAFDAAETRLVTIGKQVVQLWDLGGRLVAAIPNELGDEVANSPFAVSTQRFGAGNQQGTLRVWGWNGELEREVKARDPGVALVEANMTDSALATVDANGRVLISNTGSKVATEFDAGVVNEPPDGSWKESLRTDIGYKARFTPDGERMVILGPKSLSLWDRRGTMSWSVDLDTQDFSPLQVSDDRILLVRCTERGRGASLGGLRMCYDTSATLWDLNGRQVKTLDAGVAGETLVEVAAYNPRGNRIVTVNRDGATRVWDAAGNSIIALFAAAVAADFDPKGARLATLTERGRVHVWQVWDDLDSMIAEAERRLQQALATATGD